jgi:hypothetical protein
MCEPGADVMLSDGQRHLACWLTLQYLLGHEC